MNKHRGSHFQWQRHPPGELPSGEQCAHDLHLACVSVYQWFEGDAKKPVCARVCVCVFVVCGDLLNLVAEVLALRLSTPGQFACI